MPSEEHRYGQIDNYKNEHPNINLSNMLSEILEKNERNATNLLNIFLMLDIKKEFNSWDSSKPLHLAILKRKRNIFVSLLLRESVQSSPEKIFAKNNNGKTILDLAIQTNQRDIINDILNNFLVNENLETYKIPETFRTINLLNNSFIIDAFIAHCIISVLLEKNATFDLDVALDTVSAIAENLLISCPEITEDFFNENIFTLTHIGIALSKRTPFNFTNQILFSKCIGIDSFFSSVDMLPDTLTSLPSSIDIIDNVVLVNFITKLKFVFDLYNVIVIEDVDVVEMLLHRNNVTRAEAPDRCVNWSDDYMPLFLAMLTENLDIVKLICSKGAKINCTDYTGITALHIAAITNIDGICHYLIENGADVNAITISNRLPIYYTIEHNNSTVFELLHSKMDKRTIIHNRESLLILSIKCKCYCAYKKLINYKDDLNQTYFEALPNYEMNYWSLLSIAVSNRAYIITKDLLDNGADINNQHLSGISPIFIAIENLDLNMLHLLLLYHPNLEQIKPNTPVFRLTSTHEANIINDVLTFDDLELLPDIQYVNGNSVFERAYALYTFDKNDTDRILMVNAIFQYMAIHRMNLPTGKKNHYDESHDDWILFFTRFEQCKLEVAKLREININGHTEMNLVDLLLKRPDEIDRLMADSNVQNAIAQCNNKIREVVMDIDEFSVTFMMPVLVDAPVPLSISFASENNIRII